MEANIIRRQVLVVDDEIVNRRLLGFIVSRDYDVLYAENGKEALSLIKTNANRLSLILLDLLMPEMDGYELLEIIHNDSELRRIPVIVLTSEKSAEVKSLQLGAADFIPKPYDLPEVILARVHRSIELAEDSIIIQSMENDSVTGLYTREFFFSYSVQHDAYNPELQMDAIVLNINRFHLINELHGRSFGNAVLCRIADNIRSKTAGLHGFACRCDSDTFYIYIPHQEDYLQLLKQEKDKFESASGETKISIRLGIYENADKSIPIEQRFDRANLACNTLRNSYTSGYAMYDNDLHEKELYSDRLINEMDEALEKGQFVVFYQPKFNISGERPVLSSAEALIRWFHPELGMVSPGAFIPLFESNGLIHKLDHFVWNSAAAQIKAWKDKFGVTVPVSVNVSRIDISDPELENQLVSITEKNSIKPSELLLEITESAYTSDSRQIIAAVEALRSDGFRVEMDDFGSGYSSLNMLSELPIDALKLDMRFIRNICTNEKDKHMVELILEIARYMNVPAIAEGVETEEQCSLLKEMGCEIIQGYYFSKPVPPEQFEQFIKK